MAEQILKPRNGKTTVSGIWQTYRLQISGTLSLMTLERLLAVAVPFVLGLAINYWLRGPRCRQFLAKT